jgi:hypothetical protein
MDGAQSPGARCGKEIARAPLISRFIPVTTRWASGPQTSRWCVPPGPIATKVSNPVPVIRQTIFS